MSSLHISSCSVKHAHSEVEWYHLGLFIKFNTEAGRFLHDHYIFWNCNRFLEFLELNYADLKNNIVEPGTAIQIPNVLHWATMQHYIVLM